MSQWAGSLSRWLSYATMTRWLAGNLSVIGGDLWVNEPSQHSPTNHYATMRTGRARWLGKVAQPAVEPGWWRLLPQKKNGVAQDIFFFLGGGPPWPHILLGIFLKWLLSVLTPLTLSEKKSGNFFNKKPLAWSGSHSFFLWQIFRRISHYLLNKLWWTT